MEATPRKTQRGSNVLSALLLVVAVLGVCAFQYGDKYGLNSLPFRDVRPFVSDLAKARRLANEGNIDFFAGEAVRGETVRLRGELTDANCYLGTQTHSYDHAFCAKLCAAAGSALVFIADRDGHTYVVLSSRNGVALPKNVLDQIGVPGIVVKGRVLQASGVRALAIAGLEH
ncbi:MAG: hypothetical protein WAK48_12040 [Candidatus Acidiferrum sp.]|jgi:hypothetical protein